jgi:hypothetical protein
MNHDKTVTRGEALDQEKSSFDKVKRYAGWAALALMGIAVSAVIGVALSRVNDADPSTVAAEVIPTATTAAPRPLATATATETPEPTARPTPTETEPTDTAMAEEVEPTATKVETIPTAETSSADIGSFDGVLTEDSRPERLKRVTGAWSTNWNRHSIDYEDLLSGGPPRDGIPSIDEPVFISQEEAEKWLADNEPVISLEINGDARAYPLQILTWHEIVNDTVGDVPVVVTFCPLCNSALVFDRTLNGETYEFGTSGLLRNSDLVMYDRTTESLWQQLTGEAIVGDLVGETLKFQPASLVGFGDFREAFPDGVVLSRDTGFRRDYGRNPYAGYDRIGESPFLLSGEADDRMAAMSRVVTVSLEDAGGETVDVAYPLSILADVGVINDSQAGRDLVVFHVIGTSSALDSARIAEGVDVGATGVFDPNLDGNKLTFRREDGQIVDEETESTWNVLGQAIDGPLAGEILTPVVHGDHFWFAWAAFKPDTIIFGRE